VRASAQIGDIVIQNRANAWNLRAMVVLHHSVKYSR